MKSTKGVITDIDGNYSIEVAPDENWNSRTSAIRKCSSSKWA
ncbi:hypothetical protein NXV28_00075 [Bacteroides ovatus]|nr:hypothetical protein [Bacteroides ovatus]MCS2799143.1 hypothetical protein [Bacteroides ovatus]